MKFKVTCKWDVRPRLTPSWWEKSEKYQSDGRMAINKNIVAAVAIQKPFQYPCVLENLNNCKPMGINFDIFKALMSFIGLNFTIVPAASDTTGFRDENGSWHGVLGQIARKEINMTAYLISVKSERLDIVDYSAPVSYYSKGFILHRPANRDLTALPAFLATPLSPITWLLIGCAMLAVFLIAWLAECLLTRKKFSSHIADIWLQVTRAAFRQTDLNARHRSVTLLLSFWEFSLFFIVSFYSANLTSSLLVGNTAKDPFTGMNEFADLVWNKKYTQITDEAEGKFIPITDQKDSDNPEIRLQIAYAWNRPVFAKSMKEVIDKIAENSSLVYIGSYYHVLYHSAGDCRVKVIEDRFQMPKWLAYAFPKKSKLQEWISQALHTDATSVNAFLKRLYKRYAKRKSCIEGNSGSKASTYFPLGLEQMQGALWVLGYGILIAVVVYVIETVKCLLAKKIGRMFPCSGVSRSRVSEITNSDRRESETNSAGRKISNIALLRRFT